MCNYKKRLNLSWACSGTYGQCLSNGLVLPPCYHPCSTLPSVHSAALICFPHSSRSRSHSLTFSIALTYSSITLFHPLFILRFLSLIPFTPLLSPPVAIIILWSVCLKRWTAVEMPWRARVPAAICWLFLFPHLTSRMTPQRFPLQNNNTLRLVRASGRVLTVQSSCWPRLKVQCCWMF